MQEQDQEPEFCTMGKALSAIGEALLIVSDISALGYCHKNKIIQRFLH